MGYLNRDQSVTMKGRVACEVNSGGPAALLLPAALQLSTAILLCASPGDELVANELRSVNASALPLPDC